MKSLPQLVGHAPLLLTRTVPVARTRKRLRLPPFSKEVIQLEHVNLLITELVEDESFRFERLRKHVTHIETDEQSRWVGLAGGVQIRTV